MANPRLSPIQRAAQRLIARHGSSRAAAAAIGLDPGYFSRLRNKSDVNPSEEVLAALGLERRVIYRSTESKAKEAA